MTTRLREFLPNDYDAVIELWRSSEGLVLRDVDGREPIAEYLRRNRGLSFVVENASRIIGAVLCGTDGRRGYLQHLAVAPDYRQRGIGRQLATACVTALASRGIQKCHLMVVASNDAARTFWARLGWADRDDIRLMSHSMTNRNA
jgi:ribosomal protein S18 acetylase RimI-like enzyme